MLGCAPHANPHMPPRGVLLPTTRSPEHVCMQLRRSLPTEEDLQSVLCQRLVDPQPATNVCAWAPQAPRLQTQARRSCRSQPSWSATALGPQLLRQALQELGALCGGRFPHSGGHPWFMRLAGIVDKRLHVAGNVVKGLDDELGLSRHWLVNCVSRSLL